MPAITVKPENWSGALNYISFDAVLSMKPEERIINTTGMLGLISHAEFRGSMYGISERAFP